MFLSETFYITRMSGMSLPAQSGFELAANLVQGYAAVAQAAVAAALAGPAVCGP
jgi:hypothetical protein